MAPHSVKKVVAVAQVVQQSVEDDELKKDRKSKSRPHSITRMGPQTKSKATQVNFDLASGSVEVETEETGTQYEEIPSSCEELMDKPERVDPVEISRVLLSGWAPLIMVYYYSIFFQKILSFSSLSPVVGSVTLKSLSLLCSGQGFSSTLTTTYILENSSSFHYPLFDE